MSCNGFSDHVIHIVFVGRQESIQNTPVHVHVNGFNLLKVRVQEACDYVVVINFETLNLLI